MKPAGLCIIENGPGKTRRIKERICEKMLGLGLIPSSVDTC